VDDFTEWMTRSWNGEVRVTGSPSPNSPSQQPERLHPLTYVLMIPIFWICSLTAMFYIGTLAGAVARGYQCAMEVWR
jgi:hypothetical protein